MTIDTHMVVLESGKQRLELAPQLGGAVAAWDWRHQDDWAPLFRRWDRRSEDRYTLACFPLVPWSNRITQGGFEHRGLHYPIRANREGEPYPIHGDGWLQSWETGSQNDESVTLVLESRCFEGNPYEYRATQRFRLLPEGMEIDLMVTHLGTRPLPYGLGLHPYFMRSEHTRLRFCSTGVWLSGPDAIPTSFVEDLPPSWDYNRPASLQGPMIDNCFDGWDGQALITYPDCGWNLTMTMADCKGYTLMYRPPNLDYFCLEPITHPIDAFHMPSRPGLVELAQGQSMTLKTAFTIG